ncbi:MAG: hypothetical protein ACYCT1_14340 [Steroidobacteraceae bacterium]|jgi:hypothetical protein
MQTQTQTLAILAARFDNRAVIKAEEIYSVLVPTPKNPRRTAIEAISRGEFPVATIKINNRRYVRLVDLAAVIDGAAGTNLAIISTDRRGPGRPRKIAGGAQ